MTIDIQQIKKRLRDKEAELRTTIDKQTEAHPEPVGPVEANEGSQQFEDVAVDFLEMQQEQSVLVNEQALLTEVRNALKRIDDGSYGLCVVDKVPIPEKRLEAIPWAARCAKHEAELEQRNLSGEE